MSWKNTSAKHHLIEFCEDENRQCPYEGGIGSYCLLAGVFDDAAEAGYDYLGFVPRHEGMGVYLIFKKREGRHEG